MNLFEYVLSIDSEVETWEIKPHTIKHPKYLGAKNLSGKTFGAFKVSGYNPYLGRWIAKCSCGFYETRTSKSIENIKNNEDKCVYCRRTDGISKKFPGLKGNFDFVSLVKAYKIRKKVQAAKDNFKEKPKYPFTVKIDDIFETKEYSKTDLSVTKHACERYIERVENVSMNEAEQRIISIISTEKSGDMHSFSLVLDGYLFIVRNEKVITVIRHGYSKNLTQRVIT